MNEDGVSIKVEAVDFVCLDPRISGSLAARRHLVVASGYFIIDAGLR